MKQVKMMIQCLKNSLKKIFFISQKSDINHDCKKAFSFDLKKGDLNSNEETEEYLNNYKTTTRWQTV
ncbi:MAG: hypothetical protein ACOCWD_06070 [Tangfeifania sp.]